MSMKQNFNYISPKVKKTQSHVLQLMLKLLQEHQINWYYSIDIISLLSFGALAKNTFTRKVLFVSLRHIY